MNKETRNVLILIFTYAFLVCFAYVFMFLEGLDMIMAFLGIVALSVVSDLGNS